MADPLEKASKGYSASQGGMNIGELRNSLIEIYPDREDEIIYLGRVELENMAKKYIDKHRPNRSESSKSPIEKFPMLSLPNELLVNILLPLDPDSILSACQTNKEFATICRDDLFWKGKVKYDFGYTSKEQFQFRSGDVSSKDLSWREIWDRKVAVPVYEPFSSIDVLVETAIMDKDRRKMNEYSISDKDISKIRSNYNPRRNEGDNTKLLDKNVGMEGPDIFATFYSRSLILGSREITEYAFGSSEDVILGRYTGGITSHALFKSGITATHGGKKIDLFNYTFTVEVFFKRIKGLNKWEITNVKKFFRDELSKHVLIKPEDILVDVKNVDKNDRLISSNKVKTVIYIGINGDDIPNVYIVGIESLISQEREVEKSPLKIRGEFMSIVDIYEN